jgi:superoxide dismutase, Fe-Mn family
MDTFKAKEFNLPNIDGISVSQIEEHLKLYKGYVTHSNKIVSQIEEWKKTDTDPYLISELRRRFGFEFDGMRSHEYYFGALEGGLNPINQESGLSKKITEQFGSFENAMSELKNVAMTRGSGWAIMYFDKEYGRIQIAWIDEHHLGHLSSLQIIIAIDMWEHAFMVDYLPSEKLKYIESYIKALNFKVVESWFDKAI